MAFKLSGMATKFGWELVPSKGIMCSSHDTAVAWRVCSLGKIKRFENF